MAFGGFFGGGSSSSSSDNNSSNDTSTTSSSTPSPFSPSSLTSLPGSTSSLDTKARLQQAITNQTNLINAKYLIQRINENCFEHCIPEPGASLSSKEQTCLSTCMEKYIESWNTVSKTYVARLQKEGAAMGAGFGGAAAGGREMF